MPYEKIDLTFLGKSRRRHRDDITISCGKPRNGDIFFLIPCFFDSFAYESKQFRIISKKDPGRISITVGRKRPSKSQYKRICEILHRSRKSVPGQEYGYATSHVVA